jgi:uncharacterized protein (DUF433 family)
MAREIAPHIAVDPAVCHGAPCIRGTRIMISVLLDCLADGLTTDAILAEYPGLSAADIAAALTYASHVMQVDEEYPLEAQAG